MDGVGQVGGARQPVGAVAASERGGARGEHGATKGYLPRGTPDPWHRDGAFFGWDAVANAKATQERRVYMSGLSDEAGAGVCSLQYIWMMDMMVHVPMAMPRAVEMIDV